MTPSGKCDVPPLGWECSRPIGHSGPCAARAVPLSLDDAEAVLPRWHERHPWLTQFTALTAALLVSGILLGVGVRWYLHWSVASTVEKIQDRKAR